MVMGVEGHKDKRQSKMRRENDHDGDHDSDVMRRPSPPQLAVLPKTAELQTYSQSDDRPRGTDHELEQGIGVQGVGGKKAWCRNTMTSRLVVLAAGVWAYGMLAGRYGSRPLQQQQAATVPTAFAHQNQAGKPYQSLRYQAEADTRIRVQVFNEYTRDAPIQLYPWEHLAEPYRLTVLESSGWPYLGEHVQYR